MFVWIGFILISVLAVAAILRYLSGKSSGKWIVPYLKSLKRKGRSQSEEPINLYLCICDHFQPFWGHVSQEIAEHRVVTWCKEYEKIVLGHFDSRGRSPVHTFFYDVMHYNPQLIDNLRKLHREGIGDVEIMVDYLNDSITDFQRRIEEFRDVLFFRHGLLRKDSKGVEYGFIHGYTALRKFYNSGSWHNALKKITVLKRTGCYADFTYPSSANIIQPPMVNRLYFAADCSRNEGVGELGFPAVKNLWTDDALLLVQGPLSINWKRKRWGILPGFENGELSFLNRFSPERVKLWIKSAIGIEGISNHVFIKLFTTGGIDHNIRYFLGEEGLSFLWSYLEKEYNDGIRYKLHYVSAWEMYKIIRKLCRKSETIQNHRKAA